MWNPGMDDNDIPRFEANPNTDFKIGYYLGYREQQVQGHDKPSLIHLFQSASNEKYTVWGTKVLNDKLEEAVKLDGRLRKLWAQHPRFILVPNNRSFFKKISFGLAALERIVSQLSCDAICTPAKATHKRKKKES